jgi:hypothetical protein
VRRTPDGAGCCCCCWGLLWSSWYFVRHCRIQLLPGCKIEEGCAYSLSCFPYFVRLKEAGAGRGRTSESGGNTEACKFTNCSGTSWPGTKTQKHRCTLSPLSPLQMLRLAPPRLLPWDHRTPDKPGRPLAAGQLDSWIAQESSLQPTCNTSGCVRWEQGTGDWSRSTAAVGWILGVGIG